MKKINDMKKLYFFILVLLVTASWQKLDNKVYAFDINATEYFNLGLESSMVYKKIYYFSKALELNPRLAVAYEKRGLHYYFQEKYDKVIEDFTHYIRLVPNKADAYRMLGMAYLKIGNYEKAIANFDKAINLAPEMSAAFGYRAEALRMNYKLNEAIEDANRAIALGSDPQVLSDIYRTRAKAYQELGEEISANADFKSAEDIDPRYVLYRYLSGYIELQDIRKAGLVYMIGMAFVFIFGLKLKPPRKDE